jgi:hypothetical protein
VIGHGVTLTGLTPNTLYHARVVSKVAGKRDGISRDFVFVTEPDRANLASNPGFETGSYSPWTMFTEGGDVGLQNYPAGGGSDWFGCKAHGGNWFFGGASNGGKCKAGVYQQVSVTAGRPLNLRAWLWTWQLDQIGKTKDVTVSGRVGIDPTGGTSPYSGSVIWSPLVAAQDLFGAGAGSWTEVAVSATPLSSTATAFLQAGADTAISWTVFGWDDVVLTQEPATTALSRLSQVIGMADGSKVSIPNLIVTATESQAGAVYVEQADRAAGMRVESLDSFTVGRRVSVTGYLGTKPSGERYIYGAQKAADTTGFAMDGMMTNGRSVGTAGTNNVGLLMTAAGRVSTGGVGYVYLNDGSLPGSGLKVITSSLTTPPANGSMAVITGIVQLEGSTPETAIPILRPRAQTDVTTY